MILIIIINYLLFLLLSNMKLCIITQMFNSYCHSVLHMIHTMYAHLAEKQFFYTRNVAQMSRIAICKCPPYTQFNTFNMLTPFDKSFLCFQSGVQTNSLNSIYIKRVMMLMV